MTAFLRGCALAVAIVAISLSVAAQNAQPPRLRGAVTAVDGTEMTVAVGDGAVARVRLNDDWEVIEAARTDGSKIPQGAFVGAGATKGTNGVMRAVQIIVFPESARGRGEGHRAWNGAADGLMTNAPVTATVSSAQGPELTLTTGGQTYKVAVGPEALVVMQADVPRDRLKPGINIAFAPTRAADGTLSVSRITIGKDGAAPPI